MAKLMIGNVNKSDKLDAKGMNRLQRVGTLPTVSIAPSTVRDARELPRTLMVLSKQRTQFKNRIYATLEKHGLKVEGVSDAFGKRGRQITGELSSKLPPHPQQALGLMLNELDHVGASLKTLDDQMQQAFAPCAETTHLQSEPGVGEMLAGVIWTEIGRIERFGRAEQLASYAGLVPRENSSGGKLRYGRLEKM